ncbi:ice-binding family protein [Liberiplasma polymorphum]|uniref:ice-binding family protein n=1 Tax=Liberiplasma polymorphum TaxID=3374570 RepID=UPI003772D6F3
MKNLRKIFTNKMIVLSLLVLMIFTISACNTSKNPDGDTDIDVSAITVKSSVSVITTVGGTLQMNVTVTPTNATNKTVIWTVANGSGIATINSSGVLKAEHNGTVTVIATSVATPGATSSKVITISNQPEAVMEATLTDLQVDGHTVLGFSPLMIQYVHVVSTSLIETPVVTATKYESTASMVIENANDIQSSNVIDRTTTITVTTVDDEVKVYSIIFESNTEPVDLGTAEDFVILAETQISTATTSVITGNIGVSPVAATYLTGFSLTLHSSGEYATSDQVTGNIYASDYTSPTPEKLTTAISDMQTAYVDAAGRASNYTELYSGDLSGKTLTPGVFKFGTSVLINTDLTLNGSATDVWIFQISGKLTVASNINIILEGGADAKNIIWQVADTVAIGSGAHFEGTVLAMTDITMGTNSSINGRLYAQTAVTLDATVVTKSNDQD